MFTNIGKLRILPLTQMLAYLLFKYISVIISKIWKYVNHKDIYQYQIIKNHKSLQIYQISTNLFIKLGRGASGICFKVILKDNDEVVRCVKKI